MPYIELRWQQCHSTCEPLQQKYHSDYKMVNSLK